MVPRRSTARAGPSAAHVLLPAGHRSQIGDLDLGGIVDAGRYPVGEELHQSDASPGAAGIQAGDDLGHLGCGQGGGRDAEICSFGVAACGRRSRTLSTVNRRLDCVKRKYTRSIHARITCMDLVLIRSLIAVADAGSITDAADQIHVSQSALSRRLQQLEADLGAQLVVRSRHGVEFTDLGRQALEAGRAIAARYDAVRRSIVDQQNLERGIVRIGGGATVTSFLLPAAIAAFQSRLPRHPVLRQRGGEQRDRRRRGRRRSGARDPHPSPG